VLYVSARTKPDSLGVTASPTLLRQRFYVNDIVTRAKKVKQVLYE